MSEPMEVTGAALRALGPLLRLDKVQAGDVMLTLGRGLQATWVAMASGGLYSHAAIWLPSRLDGSSVGSRGWPYLHLVESDVLGVGPSLLETIWLDTGAGERWSVARLPEGLQAVVLLRHPDMAAVSNATLDAAGAKLTESEFYRSYAALDRLVDASSLSEIVRPAARRAMALIDPKATLPGSFCSELVAKYFRLLGLALFDPDLDPHKVSPSRLAQSLLMPVEGATIAPADLGSSARAWLPDGPLRRTLARERSLAPMVAQKGQVARFAHVVDDVTANATRQRQEQIKEVSARQAEIAVQIEALMARQDRWPGRDAMLRLVAHSVFLGCLDRRLQPLEAPDPRTQPLELYYAALALRERYLSLQRDLNDAWLRRTVLDALYVNRPKSHGGLGRPRVRRKVLKMWREHRAERPQVEAMLESFSVDAMPHVAEVIAGGACQRHIFEILGGAQEDAQVALAIKLQAPEA